jgi:Family of unknown function (DUF6364)
MRTTVDLEEDTLRRAKIVAAENGTTLSRLIEDAVKAVLNRGVRPAGARAELPTFHGLGLRPGVDLSDSAGLADVMDRDAAR